MPGPLCLFKKTETQAKIWNIKCYKLLLTTNSEGFCEEGEFVSVFTFQDATWEDVTVGGSKLSST